MDSSDNVDEDFFCGKGSKNENVHPEIGEPSSPRDSEENIGDCIILNYENFKEGRGLSQRSESKYDAESLEYVFKQLKFNVNQFPDLSKSETCETLKKASINMTRESKYFVCCILTHGDKNDRLATKDGWLDLNEFLCYFYPTTCKNLMGKPKIFIIQACRGGETERNVPKESTDSVADEDELYSDFIIGYSTYPGKLSFKNSHFGSFYIQELCYCLEQFSSNLDLLQILTVVNYRMANFFVSLSNKKGLNESLQMPTFTSTLRSHVLFQNGIEPNESEYRNMHLERMKYFRLNLSSVQNPYHDVHSYVIKSVKFFQILTKKCAPEELNEAIADLSVHMKRNYEHERAECNLKKSKIIEKLKSYASNADTDCTICLIATPYKNKYLYDEGGRKFSKKEVFENFVQNQHSSLVGKPKIFIFLMCKRNDPVESSDGYNESLHSHFTAEHADILDITISLKNQEHLLKSMKEFCDQLEKYGKSEDLLTILTRISSIYFSEKYDFLKAKPPSTFSFNSTLTKNVFLPLLP